MGTEKKKQEQQLFELSPAHAPSTRAAHALPGGGYSYKHLSEAKKKVKKKFILELYMDTCVPTVIIIIIGRRATATAMSTATTTTTTTKNKRATAEEEERGSNETCSGSPRRCA